MLSGIRLVCGAAEFAAHRHAGMQRKGRSGEPYINHLAEVANLLSLATADEDAELVAAGWLHDTIEKTGTRPDELAERFGTRVAELVLEVTDDDGRLTKSERRQRQIEEAPTKSAGAKLIKIADKLSNLRARMVPDLDQQQREELADYLGFAERVVAGCRGVSTTLDQMIDETVRQAKGRL